MQNQISTNLLQALWKIYQRPDRPVAWTQGGNLPWNEPEFSARMLREHLDEAHGAASRQSNERQMQIDWLWAKLELKPGVQVCDLTCGPGLYAVELARRGCQVTGIDFGPAAVAYARDLAHSNGVANRCTMIEQDVRAVELGAETFDAALFIYGQLAVFQRAETQQLLDKIAACLKPGGRLVVELLNLDRIDKTDGKWWFTDNSGLWGDGPFLHLGERFWDDEQAIATERFYVLHLDSGAFTEVHLSDQAYSVETMCAMLQRAGFAHVQAHRRWGGLPLYDADEWVVYIAQKGVK